MLIRFLFFISICFLSLSQARAAETLGIVTGPQTGTYYLFGKDMASVAKKSGIKLQVKDSFGSLDNIKRINSTENAAIGIVQLDVLGFLSRSKSASSRKMVSNLRMVFPLYDEEIHVLARKEIKTFAQLAGKKVAIGKEGSGYLLTATNLLAMMSITPSDTLKMPAAQSVVAVLKGKIDAAIFVGGKPVRLFKNLEELSLPENQKYTHMLERVHFLPLNSTKMFEEYNPAMLTPEDYSFVKEPVPTIAVPAILVSYNFSKGGKKRCGILATLTATIRAHIDELKEKGHPKWNEANLDKASDLWKIDKCAWPKQPKIISKTDKAELLHILEKE